MNDEQLWARVSELRAKGRTPKEIARALGVGKAKIGPVIRQLAAADETPISERAVLGCWVSPGWSDGLSVEPLPGWPDPGPVDESASGLVNVLIVRDAGRGRASVCGYLADVYCLGIKNVLPPRVMDRNRLDEFRRSYFEAYAAQPVEVPLDLAQHIVFGAIEYARGLGFEPHGDFEQVAGHLGEWAGRSAITFGFNGKPYFVQGPRDNHSAVLRTLKASVGEGNFDYLAVL